METITDYELNCQVAEQVMGWKTKYFDRPELQGTYWVVDRTRMVLDSPVHRARLKLGIKEDKPGDGFVFAPTIDPVAWMEVVERMRELGHYAFFDNAMSEGKHWSVLFLTGGHSAYPSTQNVSLGRAICEAALKAVS